MSKTDKLLFAAFCLGCLAFGAFAALAIPPYGF